MKKLLAIIVLGLMFSGNVNAFTQQSVINQHLSDDKLEKIEGIWVFQPGGRIIAVYKSNNNYYAKVVHSSKESPGAVQWSNLYKGSSNYFRAKEPCNVENKNNNTGHVRRSFLVTCTLNLIVRENEISVTGTFPPGVIEVGSNTYNRSLFRLWPENFKSHNAKFEKKKEPKKKKDEFKPSSGTAFFVTQKGHVITNFHVVEGCKDKSKIIYQNKEIKVKLLAKDKYLDLALLKADIESKDFIKISNKPPKKLQRIIAAGYPFGKYLSDDMKFTSGIVSSLKGLGDDSTRLQIDAALNPGNSGGPIVDEQTGNLVAVAVSGLNKDLIDNQAVNFGIKAGSVKNFLESNQINTLTQSKYSFGSVDLSDILEKATVYTFCK